MRRTCTFGAGCLGAMAQTNIPNVRGCVRETRPSTTTKTTTLRLNTHNRDLDLSSLFTVHFVMEPQAANLCERCQLLAFDERKAGCSVTVSKKGGECLIMPERWRKDEDQREMWELPVDWDAPVELVDSLPSLPALEAAAQSGCEFCGFIRGEILSRDTDERSGKVEVALRRLFRQQVRCVIQMSWVWCARNVQDGVYGDSAGYLYLSVKVTEVRDDGSPCESATLGLLAEATEREFFACHTRYRNSQLLC